MKADVRDVRLKAKQIRSALEPAFSADTALPGSNRRVSSAGHCAAVAAIVRRRLGGWLVTTTRRICLRIVNSPKHRVDLFDPVVDTVADPFADPEQRIIDADSTRRLWNFVSELSPRRQTLIRVLFTEHSRSYTEVARLAGIPAGGIGPTRARALAQLRGKLEEHGLGPAAW